MDLHQRSLRVGITALVLALVFRLFDLGLPEKLAAWLVQPDVAAFLIYLETGRDVRFPSSEAVFSPDFLESPPAVSPLPAFSGDTPVELTNSSTKDPDISALLSAPLQWDLYADEPRVLILHTHTTESYTRSGETYEETAAFRTLDEDYNMLSIGSRVAQRLTQAGIAVIHDRSVHDYPSYNGSYTDARSSAEDWLEACPSIELVLDLHRDASGSLYNQLRTTVETAAGATAQLMVVLGTTYDTFEENLSLGLKLHAQLECQAPGITRPLQLRASRFNQDLCPGSLLIEVGAAGNTHEEALRAADQLADAVIALARGTQSAPA